MKKLLAMVLALVMTLSLAVSANAAFKDDKDINDTYAEAAAVLDGMGVFEGIDGNFLPKDNITRAQVAAIIYRVTTTDTAGYGKDKSGLYASYNKFSDMTGAGWAAGYIGYAANAEYVKGYPDGTFKPSGNVTGYEVLAMILRAIGYDKNNEFSGSDWALHVAQTAQEAGILKNIKGVDLNAAASRELVAEMLFRAIAVAPMVTYTSAFGYQTVSFDTKKDGKFFKENETLGHKNFLLEDDDANDIWGRPTTKWFKDKNEDGKYTAKETVYAEITAKADAEFHEPTTQCDICEALSEKTSAKVVEAYVNGSTATADVKDLLTTYKATETKAKVGEQGQIAEYYKVDGGYRLVVIDTYLAKVTDVVEEKLDSKGHTTRDDCLQLSVWNKADGTYSTIYAEGNDYAEDAYILVHVNAVDKTDIITVTNAKATPYNTVEIVGEAKSFTGAQTKIYHNSDKHTIGGEDYMDAYRFYKNVAEGSSVKYTWFLDQFGNLIGSDDIDNTSYAVLKQIYWTGSDRTGYAEAVLVDADGKESTVKVNKIDGISTSTAATSAKPGDGEFEGAFTENLDGATPRVSDSNTSGSFDTVNSKLYAYVSTWDDYNEAYNGMALFMVEPNDDDTVNLQGYGEIKYAANATINPTSSVLSVFESDEDNADVTAKYAMSSNVDIIVRETNDKDEYVYNTDYTLKTLKKYADQSVEVYFVTEGKFVTAIYVKNAIDASAFGTYVFMPEANNSNWWTDPKTNKEYVNVYVDGEAQTIEVSNGVAKFLDANQGKLIKVNDKAAWVTSLGTAYGKLNDASKLAVVNEDNDNLKWVANTVIADYISDYEFQKDNTVLVSKVLGAGENADFNVIDLENAKVVVWDNADAKDVKITKDTFEQYGVWAVTAKTDYEGSATTLYLGKKLDADLGLNITVDPANAGTVTSTGAASYTFTGAAGVTSATLKFAASSAKSTVDKDSAVVNADGTVTVKVTNEAGFSKTYTITTKLTAAEKATINYVLKVNSNGVVTTYNYTWTGVAGTCDHQDFASVKDSRFPEFVAADGTYTLVKDVNPSTFVIAAGETKTLEYEVTMLNSVNPQP